MAGKKEVVWVVGLSDIGRSPRLQNHALSLAEQADLTVHVVGYQGSKALPALLQSSKIHQHYIPETPALLHKLPRILALPLKAVLQLLLLLLLLLFKLPAPGAILLQVPPAIPALLLCKLVCSVRRARLIIDWHNFAYTLMGISLGDSHFLVRMAEAHERFWGRQAHAHLCVTNAMQAELAANWRITARVFHDHPPASFRPSTLAEEHKLLLRLEADLIKPLHPRDCCSSLADHAASASITRRPQNGAVEEASPPKAENPAPIPDVIDDLWQGSPARSTRSKYRQASPQSSPLPVSEPAPSILPSQQTLCTELVQDRVQLREGRPALVVSSTSWTPDEDFSILLEAATLYDKEACSQAGAYPRLLILVTGKGPQREACLARMSKLDLRWVAFRSLWLEPSDYPLLLGSCDLGVSLHTSSSGLDLPMKVVDMFGCGLPVLSAAYSCISELVEPGMTGLLFNEPRELAEQLLQLFQGFPTQTSADLQNMRSHVQARRKAPNASWSQAWEQTVLPLFVSTDFVCNPFYIV